MVHATPGFSPELTDELSRRTLPIFFSILEMLLRAGVTTVAEAAFQHRLWRPGLERLCGLARIRIVHCTVDAGAALSRSLQRSEENPLRRAHSDSRTRDAASFTRRYLAFGRVFGERS